MFMFPAYKEITGEVVSDFIELHQAKITRYQELYNLYKGDAPILYGEAKENYKPDNRLVVNFPRHQVDNFNGFFAGIAPKISYNNPDKTDEQNKLIDDIINDFERRCDMSEFMLEMSKQVSIFGHSFAYLYQDENSETQLAKVSPENAFVVYEQSIAQKPLFGVYYITNDDDKIEGHLHTTSHSYNLMEGKNGINLYDETPQYYGDVPIVEFVENDERLSLVGVTESLTNAYNKAISEKSNDVDYFADAYLAVLGAELDEDGTYKIRDNRIINLYGTDDASKIVVKFLEKPDADQTQENLLDRLERLIYETSMIANISDTKFGAADLSGIALEFKLQPMRNLAAVKERKFVKSFNKIFKMFFALPTNIPPAYKDEWIEVQYSFTRNLPRNVQDEAKTARELDGIVSDETKLSVLSIVDNTQKELERIEKENARPMSDLEQSFIDSLGAEDD